jgi:hypothetical protein
MGDGAEPTEAAGFAHTGSEQTQAIADSTENAPAELAWSAAHEEPERQAASEKASRALWLGPVMALVAAAIAVTAALLFYIHRTPVPKMPAAAPSSASTRLVPPVQVALPEVPPGYAGCPGTVVAHHDIEHQTLGAVRVFLLRGSGPLDGCIAAVANSGQALPPIQIDQANIEHFAFANPATDATGNTFVLYNPGKYDGVLVLIPNSGGFEDIGWDHYPGDPSFTLRRSGKHAYWYDSQLLGPGPNGQFTIRKKYHDCTPDCASGTTTSQDLHWNGSDYVP